MIYDYDGKDYDDDDDDDDVILQTLSLLIHAQQY